jgi:hypothetical protein
MDFNSLKGNTLVAVTGCYKDSDEIRFTTGDGEQFRMLHYQDCCESVRVEDVCSDVEDLLNSIIVRAEERSNGVQDIVGRLR